MSRIFKVRETERKVKDSFYQRKFRVKHKKHLTHDQNMKV